MSKIQQMLLIEPNSTKGQKEQYVYTGFTCPFCSGQKGWWHGGGGHNSRDEEWCECAKCRGSGKVKVLINLSWSSDSSMKNEKIKNKNNDDDDEGIETVCSKV